MALNYLLITILAYFAALAANDISPPGRTLTASSCLRFPGGSSEPRPIRARITRPS